MIFLLLVEDNLRLRQALKTGLEATGMVQVMHDCESGEEALDYCLKTLVPNRLLERPPGQS